MGERFSLVNDPRNPYNRLLTVERLGNIVGGKGVRYVNVDMDVSSPNPGTRKTKLTTFRP